MSLHRMDLAGTGRTIAGPRIGSFRFALLKGNVRLIRFRAISASLFAAMLLALALAAPGHASAQEAEVPYWVSLSKDRTNLRVGPGREYRISWVYVRKDVPMKVLRVMGGWRLVQEPDGTRGWILARFLSRTRTAIVKGDAIQIREKSDGSGVVMWRAAPGVIGRLGACEAGWCRFDIEGRSGYAPQNALWGAGEP